MKKIYLLACTLIFSVAVNAGIKRWNGPNDAEWSVGENWKPLGVPSSSDDVIVDNGTTVKLSSNAIVINSIAILNNSGLNVMSGADGKTTLSFQDPVANANANGTAITLATGGVLRVSGTVIINSSTQVVFKAGLDVSDPNTNIIIEYGGKISIDKCNYGVSLARGSTLTNAGTLEIGGTINGGGIFIADGTLQNNSYGIISINNVQAPAITTAILANRVHAINNSGIINIGETGAINGPGISGIDLSINNSGIIYINQATNAIELTRGTLITAANSGIQIGTTAAVTGSGIVTSGTTAITNGGAIYIKNANGNGLELNAGTFTNGGKLQLGHYFIDPSNGPGSGNIGGIGIHADNGAVFTNNSDIKFGIVSGDAIRLENGSSFTNLWDMRGDDPTGFTGMNTVVSGSWLVVDNSTFINNATCNAYTSKGGAGPGTTAIAIVLKNSGNAENRGTISVKGPRTALSLDGNSDFKNYNSFDADDRFSNCLYVAGGSTFSNIAPGTAHFSGSLYNTGPSMVLITGSGSRIVNSGSMLVEWGVQHHGILIDDHGSLQNTGEGVINVQNIAYEGVYLSDGARFINNSTIELNEISGSFLRVSNGSTFTNNNTINIGNKNTIDRGTSIFLEGANTLFSNSAAGKISINHVAAQYNGISVATAATLRNFGKITWGTPTLAFPGAAGLQVTTGATFSNRSGSSLEFVNCNGDAIIADVSRGVGTSSLGFSGGGTVKFGNIAGRGIYNSDPTVEISNSGTFETMPGGKMKLQAYITNASPDGLLTNNDGTVTMGVAFGNGSRITNGTTGTITNTSDFTNASGGQITNNGTWNMTGAFITYNGSVCKGSGTFKGAVFNNAGTVAPGNSPGCLAMANGFNNGSTGTLDIELNGKMTACTEFDRANVTGTATLSGALKVTLGGGYSPSNGDVITILKSTSLSGTFSSNNLAAGWKIMYNFPLSGDVSLNFYLAPLPLSLVDFNATKEGEKAKASWTTSNEINTDHFELERSNDGIPFQKLASVSSANSSGNHHYEATDPLPLQGRNYYRLRMVDIDGHYTYSRIAQLDFDKAQSFITSVYPNPVKDLVNIAVTEGGNIQLISQDGKIMLTKQLPARGIYQVDLSAFATGVYLVKASNGVTYKLVKQ